jgi:hypothetical protein
LSRASSRDVTPQAARFFAGNYTAGGGHGLFRGVPDHGGIRYQRRLILRITCDRCGKDRMVNKSAWAGQGKAGQSAGPAFTSAPTVA